MITDILLAAWVIAPILIIAAAVIAIAVMPLNERAAPSRLGDIANEVAAKLRARRPAP